MDGTARHRAERGIILQILVTAGDWVTVRSIQNAMDYRGFSISMLSLRFHMDRYLAPQGYIEVKRARDLKDILRTDHEAKPSDVMLACISPKGIALLNGSREDAEVEVG